MSRAIAPSSGKPYGLARVCRVWRAARVLRLMRENDLLAPSNAAQAG
jgi:hypothetical protein